MVGVGRDLCGSVDFKAICTSPRPNKTAVALTLLVSETVGSAERDSHKSSANRNSLVPRQSQTISLRTCWWSSGAEKGSELCILVHRKYPSIHPQWTRMLWAEQREVAILETRSKSPQLFVFLVSLGHLPTVSSHEHSVPGLEHKRL